MLKYIFVFCSFIFAQSYEDSVRLSGAVDDSVEETGTLLDTAKEERSVLDTEEVNTDTVENVPAKDYDETIVYENGDTLFENYQNGLLYHEIKKNKKGKIILFREFYDTGELLYEETLKYSKEFYKSGHVKKKIDYEIGRLRDEEMWYYYRYGARNKEKVNVQWFFKNGKRQASISLKLSRVRNTKKYISGKYMYKFKMKACFRKTDEEKMACENYDDFYYETWIEKSIDEVSTDNEDEDNFWFNFHDNHIE